MLNYPLPDFRILDLILFINDFFSPEPPDEVTVSFCFAWVSACASSKALLTSFISFHCLLAANPMVMMSCPVLLSISSNLSLLTLEYSQNYPEIIDKLSLLNLNVVGVTRLKFWPLPGWGLGAGGLPFFENKMTLKCGMCLEYLIFFNTRHSTAAFKSGATAQLVPRKILSYICTYLLIL